MSQVIDTKVVEMQFDNSKFEKNIEVSLNSLKFLNKNIDEAGKNRGSLDELAHASDQVGISFDNMNMKSKISLNLFDMIAGVGTKAFNRISDAVAGFALNMANSLSGMQAMRDGFAEYELKMGSVQTILAGAKIIDPKTGKNIDDDTKRLEIVNQKLEDLNAYSDKTIYSFKDMTANIGKFTNAGVNLDDSVQAIQGVANVAAVSGANAGEASRAMYNFSQALSSGAVKLIDWKSIENANMATVEFKQQLLDTAVAMGTVVKEGDMYQTTTTDAQGKVSDLFNSTTKFNDALSNQWMTTEVLTQTLKNYSTDVNEMTADEVESYKAKLKSIGYTEEQVEGIIKLSKKAFAAATEVKTFSQMIDTLKESLGSGWAQSFEIIFGDFKEAKALWTSLNNTIDGLLSPIGKARNEMLKIWKENGGRDAVIQSFKNLYHAVENLVAPLKNLWKAFTPNLSHTGKGLATVSKGIEKLTALVAKATSAIGKALAFVLRPVAAAGMLISKGLMKLFGVIKTVWGKVSGVFASIGKAVSSFTKTISTSFGKFITPKIKAFQTTISTTFDDIKKRLKNSKSLNSLIKAFNDLRTIVHDFFSRVVSHATIYANRFSKYLGKIWDAVSPLISNALTSVLKSLSNFILPKLRKALEFVTDKFKDFGAFIGKFNIKKTGLYKGLSELPNKIKALSDNKTLNKVFNDIKGFGSEALTFLSDKFVTLKTNLESIKMPSGLTDVFENIKNFIKGVFGEDSVNDSLSKTLGDAAKATEDIAGEESGQKLTTFQKFLEGISTAFEWLKNAAKTAKDAIADFVDFVKSNVPKALTSLHDFIAGDDGILQISDIGDVIYTVSDALSMLLNAYGFEQISVSAKGISDAFGDLSESIVVLSKRAGNKMNMSALRDFAIGVGILTGALWVLSKIPGDKLVKAGAAILVLGIALSKFFGVISSGSAKLNETAGFIPIAILLIAISASMIAVAASVGILVGVLAIFPKVIKQYNNLGDGFRKGMDRVKEVLEEIFEYLDHAASSKYSFRSAMALLALVFALSQLSKTIKKYASKKMGEAMEEGLARIKEVLEALGGFLASLQIGSFSFINIGIDFDTVGMALMILAIGHMIEKITPMIQELAKLSPDEYKTAFNALDRIFFELAAFLAEGALLSKFTGTGLTQWLGIGVTITLLASAIGSAVGSISTLADLAANNPEGLETALEALKGIFRSFGILLAIIGTLKPSASVGTLFGLSLAIGVMTFCVVALVPIAKSHPEELIAAVMSLGFLMVALGATMFLVKSASGKASVKDILILLAMTFAMTILAQEIRRMAKVGGDASGIIAAGAAIGIAAMSIAGAMKVLSSIPMINPLVLGGLALLALAIWGVAYAIMAFKGSSGQMSEGSAAVTQGIEDMGSGATEALSNLGESLDLGGLLDGLGAKIGEKIRNFDLGEALHGMIQSVAAKAVNFAQDAIDIGTNLIDGISTAISNPANVEKIKGSIVALGKALLDSFKLFFGINSPSTVMAEQGGFILDGLVQGLMEFPEKLAEWVSGIGKFILEKLQGFFGGVVNKGKTLAQGIGKGIQNGKEFVGKKASAVGKAALQKIGKAKEWADNAGKSVKAFGEKLQQSHNPVSKAAGKMILGATSTIDHAQKIFGTSAKQAANKFQSEIRSGASPAKAAAMAIVTGAKSAFYGIGTSFLQFGINAAQGFKNGIMNMVSSIAQAAANLVRRAKEAAKNEQHSKSPSKDFMKYGTWAAQGYALGMTSRASSRFIESNARKMVDSAKNIATSTSFGFGALALDSNPALRSLAYAMGEISTSLDEGIDAGPTIRPVIDMSDVNRNASIIDAMFGNRSINANMNAIRYAQNGFDQSIKNRSDASVAASIGKLTKRLDSMTDAMNSRSLNNYITVDGAADPEAFADGLIRSFRLNARTV